VSRDQEEQALLEKKLTSDWQIIVSRDQEEQAVLEKKLTSD
jgi:hypothetical protein